MFSEVVDALLLRCPLFIYSPYLGESAFRGSTMYYTWVRDVIIFFFLDFTIELARGRSLDIFFKLIFLQQF